MTLLMLLRYTTYRAINNHFFMLDFCYFMQISVITQTLLFPPTSAFGAAWFKANFALRSKCKYRVTGPLLSTEM